MSTGDGTSDLNQYSYSYSPWGGSTYTSTPDYSPWGGSTYTSTSTTHPGVAVPVLGAALCVLRAPAHVVDVLGPVGEGGAAPVAGAWRHEAV